MVIVEFGIVTIELSTHLILVLLKVILITVPEYNPTFTKSPITKGLSDKIVKPLSKLFTVSCAASEIKTVPIPRPVIRPLKSNPKT